MIPFHSKLILKQKKRLLLVFEQIICVKMMDWKEGIQCKKKQKKPFKKTPFLYLSFLTLAQMCVFFPYILVEKKKLN